MTNLLDVPESYHSDYLPECLCGVYFIWLKLLSSLTANKGDLSLEKIICLLVVSLLHLNWCRQRLVRYIYFLRRTTKLLDVMLKTRTSKAYIVSLGDAITL